MAFESLMHAQVKISRAVLTECYYRALNTAHIFSLPGGLNYFKEAGLLCYWLRKLKPFRILLDESMDTETLSQLSTFPINECISLYVSIDIIRFSHHVALESIENAAEKEINLDAINSNFARLRKMEREVVLSLRYFVFSGGSIPLILEALLRIPLDDQFAFDQE